VSRYWRNVSLVISVSFRFIKKIFWKFRPCLPIYRTYRYTQKISSFIKNIKKYIPIKDSFLSTDLNNFSNDEAHEVHIYTEIQENDTKEWYIQILLYRDASFKKNFFNKKKQFKIHTTSQYH